MNDFFQQSIYVHYHWKYDKPMSIGVFFEESVYVSFNKKVFMEENSVANQKVTSK